MLSRQYCCEGVGGFTDCGGCHSREEEEEAWFPHAVVLFQEERQITLAFPESVVCASVLMCCTHGFVEYDGMSRCLTLLFLMLHTKFVSLSVPRRWFLIIVV